MPSRRLLVLEEHACWTMLTFTNARDFQVYTKEVLRQLSGKYIRELLGRTAEVLTDIVGLLNFETLF